MKKLYTLLKSTSRLLLFLLTLTALTGAFSVNAQTPQVGDYRSKATGIWTALTTWEYYDGTSWAQPTGTSPQGYPGQFAGTNNVSIIGGYAVNLNAAIPSPFTSLTIGDDSFGTNIDQLKILDQTDYLLNTLL